MLCVGAEVTPEGCVLRDAVCRYRSDMKGCLLTNQYPRTKWEASCLAPGLCSNIGSCFNLWIDNEKSKSAFFFLGNLCFIK